ncbi:hypothetical protein, variant 3 [Cryptococcus amylolentus CBS 6039]|uniref:Glycoside hydrolase family 43 protein n=1 Tax=Cryptococcus amylolentus CBS 6039 TaxID=1295533 RepID=A0A1E3HEH6_9TREE|nr:hypothetical protein, variant 2 [Cryptococcus amylolentus CBS 6039]XP_018990520.1 hypothetical protein, variant 3 [Cryptococcus amylolentus CBS 6039]ODN74738.1 hypothetical protein, variant 2 [Cryptococcus amylolentus CBS 6039]ODN74739.1 hypothetical protein, variant 3 [Cryptococcus amylolentus CBS 6039]
MFIPTLLSTVLSILAFARAAQFSNPIRDSGADPFIVYDNSTSQYYLITTTATDLRLISSPTLGGLYNGTDTQVYSTNDTQVLRHVWAGELHKVDGSWYIYFSWLERPWVIKGGADPLDAYPGPPVQLSADFGIDGTILTHNSSLYFLWSCLTKSPSADSICIAPLSSPTSLVNASTAVISSPTEEWENQGNASINEAPQALYWEGEKYLTFSASHCKSAGYSLGLLHLTGDDPLLPSSWTKTEGPVFSSANGEYGPGHNGIFASPDGTELWNVYHAVTNSSGSCGTDRQTFAQPIDLSQFSTEGPIFGIPLAKGHVIDGPSGE